MACLFVPVFSHFSFKKKHPFLWIALITIQIPSFYCLECHFAPLCSKQPKKQFNFSPFHQEHTCIPPTRTARHISPLACLLAKKGVGRSREASALARRGSTWRMPFPGSELLLRHVPFLRLAQWRKQLDFRLIFRTFSPRVLVFEGLKREPRLIMVS